MRGSPADRLDRLPFRAGSALAGDPGAEAPQGRPGPLGGGLSREVAAFGLQAAAQGDDRLNACL